MFGKIINATMKLSSFFNAGMVALSIFLSTKIIFPYSLAILIWLPKFIETLILFTAR